MIAIGRFPILWHIMKYYAQFKHEDFVLCLGHKGNVIKDFFLNYQALTNDFTIRLGSSQQVEFHTKHHEDWRVTLAETGLEAMTGARVKRIQRFVSDDENFMLTYGDGVSDVDLNALLAFHKQHKRIMTVTGVRPPGRFGEIEADATGAVAGFNEKPQVTGGMISGGFFVCRREFFDYLGTNEDLVLEQGPMRALAAAGQMMVYRHDGFWHPMDTYRDYKYLNTLFEENKAPWVAWK
jgi:glucose-1-phosphate cytidylyltransferase